MQLEDERGKDGRGRIGGGRGEAEWRKQSEELGL